MEMAMLVQMGLGTCHLLPVPYLSFNSVRLTSKLKSMRSSSCYRLNTQVWTLINID